MSDNEHGNHVATCLCCKHCSLTYDAGYSSYTPGDGGGIQCNLNLFADIYQGDAPRMDGHGLHSLVDMGRNCKKFEGR